MATTATSEGTLIVEDGTELYTKTWKVGQLDDAKQVINVGLQTPGPDGPKAILVFVHGFSDHCNAYYGFFPTLASAGIEVRSFDQRGFGRSVHKPSEKGNSGPTSLVLSDISSFLRTMVPAPAPLFLMGHSMGGAEVLCWAAAGPVELRRHVRGYLAEAPFIAFHAATRPSVVAVVAGRLVSRVLPRRQLVFKLDEKLLSRDPAVQRAFADDELCHDTGTLEGIAGNLDRAAGLDSGAVRVPADAGEGGRTRIWLSHGTADGVCDCRGTQKLFDRLDGVEDKALKLYDGWYHKLHAEPSPDRETYAKDVSDWILARCGSNGNLVAPKL